MYKIAISLIIAGLVLTTVILCISQPKMHKTLFIHDSAYEIVEPTKQEETKTTIPVQTVKQEIKTKKTAAPSKVVTPQKVTQQINKTNTKQNIQRVEAKKQTPVTAKTTTVQKKTETVTQPQKKTDVQKQTPPVTKTVTETERIHQETIAWNQWRSNIQNQIMKDTKLPMIQPGTIFKFSFDVDKYGKVTNVKTWSTTPSYTPYAIQYIAPVIRSYQGRSILTFPSGSNRISTTVEGGWKISNTSKYSSSSDFHDYERISK